MDDGNLGIIGGVLGSVLGVIGGIIGTYFSIKNTAGPSEKNFMIKASIVVWGAITLFLALLLFLPKPYNLTMWVFYGLGLPLGIRYINKNQQKIRELENNK